MARDPTYPFAFHHPHGLRPQATRALPFDTMLRANLTAYPQSASEQDEVSIAVGCDDVDLNGVPS